MKKKIQIEQLSFGYGKELLMENINAQICSGDFVALTGPNGSGKSTLVRLMIGALKPVKGHIERDETENIGYVPQSTLAQGLTFPMTCTEVVLLNLYHEMGFFKIARAKHRRQAVEALETVGMGEKTAYLFNHLSGGEKQRVLIAKALVNNPSVLIFDEPTAGIDQDSKKMLYDLLVHLNTRHGITILVVTHELENTRHYFSKIWRLDQRKLDIEKEDAVC